MLTLSVIIPTYNRAELLVRALESVSVQTFRDYEIIVVDDGSEDGTRQAIEETRINVEYVRIEHSGLPAVARNKGIEIAQGDYIAFLDSDDQWLPEKLARQLEVFATSEDIGLVCSNALVLKDEGMEEARPYLRPEQGHSGHVLAKLLQDNFVITSTAMIRRCLLDQVGFFNTSKLLMVGEDYDLWLRIAAVSQVGYLEELLAIYRDRSDSVRSEQSRERYWSAMLTILERLRQFKPAVEQEYSDLLNKLAYNYQGNLCDAYLGAHHSRKRALKCSLSMIRSDPLRSLGYRKMIKSILTTGIASGRQRERHDRSDALR